MDIVINPEQLRRVASQFQGVQARLEEHARLVPSYYSSLDWEVRQQARMDQAISQLSTDVRKLAQWADGLSKLLTYLAEGFESLDKRGQANFDKILGVFMDGVGELMLYEPLAGLPIDQIQALLGGGDIFGKLEASLRAGDLREASRVWIQGARVPEVYYGPAVAGAIGSTIVSWPTIESKIEGTLPGRRPRVEVGDLRNGHAGRDGAGGIHEHLRQAARNIPGMGKVLDKVDQSRRRPGSVGSIVSGAVERGVDTLLDSVRVGTSRSVSVGAALISKRIGGDKNYIGIKAGSAEAYAHGYLQADIARGRVTAGGSAGVRADVVRVEAGLHRSIGNENLGAAGTVRGDASIGANASVHLALQADIRKGQVSANAGVDAFAGARVTGTGRAEASLAGTTMAVNGQATAFLGVGVAANAGGHIDLAAGKFGARVEVGAALGIGAKVALGFEIDAGKTIQNIKNTVTNLIPKIQIPKVQLPKFQLPKIQLPKIPWPPKITLPKIQLPKIQLPKIQLPKIQIPKIQLPKFQLPKIQLPKIPWPPKIQLPKIQLPKFQLPKIQLPKIQLPKIQLPKIQLPKIQLPKIQLPKIQLPKISLPKLEPPKWKWPPWG